MPRSHRNKQAARGGTAPRASAVTPSDALPGSAPPVAAHSSRSRPASVAWIALALVALTAAVYAPVRHHQFVALDDVSYVTENRHVAQGLTWPGVTWAFTTGHASNWHPLTWLSHMLDAQLFGVNAGPQHLVNVALHVLNTLLLFIVLWRMTGATGRSAFVAALFAVHPLHVESVAWVAERKDVLSTAFWLLTIWAYLGYARRPGRARYGIVLACFALGLMAKPMLVTLPFVLLLMDVWPLCRRQAAGGTYNPAEAGSHVPYNPAKAGSHVPYNPAKAGSHVPCNPAEAGSHVRLGRFAWSALVVEKLPLFALAAASSVITIVVQRQGGAVGELGAFPLPARVANALVACLSYLARTFWPSGLSVFYPYPSSPRIGLAVLALAVLLAVSVLAVRSMRRWPWLAVGWFWYLVTLAPVIGLVQVGRQSMADRYTYVPLVGIFVIVAWGVPDLASRWRLAARAIPLAAVIVVSGCAIAARAQVGYWQDSFTLWSHALAVDPGNYYAHTGVAIAAEEAGRAEEASRHFAEAIRIAPDYAEAYHGWGLLLANQGRLDQAIERYGMAVRLKPDFVAAHNNMGAALASAGRFADAASHYREALRLVPDDPRLHANLGQALASQGKLDEAITELGHAVNLDPRMAFAHDALGLALFRLGRTDEAIAHYREALGVDPASVGARNNLALALSAQGKTDQAIAEYREALRIDPNHADVHNNLGFALAAQGKVDEAMPHFREAIRLRPDFEMAHQCLALALGASGRFEEAAAEFREVLRLNPNNESARRGLDKLSGVLPARDGR